MTRPATPVASGPEVYTPGLAQGLALGHPELRDGRVRDRREMTKSELIDVFKRHIKGSRLDAALTMLMNRKFVRRGERHGKGRTTEVWGLMR